MALGASGKLMGLILARWRLPLSIAAAVALLGLIAALHHYRGAYNAQKALRRADKAAYTQAQTEAARIAREALLHQEHIYISKAKEIEHEYVVKIANARSATDRFIAANRVRGQAAAGNASGAIASTQGSGAAVSASVPADAIMVSERDVQACTEASIYAVSAHDWAAGL
jgi:hypothetical protein